jgi:hypothetical protein
MKQRSRLRRFSIGAARVAGVGTLVVWGLIALGLLAGWVQSTRLGVIARREGFHRSLVDQTSSVFHVDSVHGRLGLGVRRSWDRTGYGGALTRLFGGATNWTLWQRTDVPIDAFAAAVVGLSPPVAPAPPAGYVYTYPAPGVAVGRPSPGLRSGATIVQSPGAPPEPLWRRMGFNWSWHSEAAPGQRWLYELEVSTPYWALAGVLIVPYPLVLRWSWRRRVRRRRGDAGCCLGCGYDLRVTTSGRCSECGVEVAPSAMSRV